MQTRNALIVLVIVLLYIFLRFALNPHPSVTLEAKPWNEGNVHVWHSLGRNASYTNVAGGTRCQRLDDEWYRLGAGDTAIYYYKVNCDGIVGFVERDQTR